MYTFSNSSLEVDINRKIRDAADILTLAQHSARTTGDAADILIAQMANEGCLDSNSVIDPTLIQSFPSGGKLLNRSSPSPLPELRSDFFQQIATGG
jgi:hypothetical protein